MPRVKSESNGVAVSRDGSTLLVSDNCGGSDAIHEFSVADGSRLRVIGGAGDGPLQFRSPHQVWVASDGFVFVADRGNSRVQVLTPSLDFHGYIAVQRGPSGVCANDAIFVVSHASVHCIAIYNRGNGAFIRGFGRWGSRNGQLDNPQGLCFMAGDRHVAVAECNNNRVSVFSVEGEFVRHVGVGKLSWPAGVACSAFDELVVADRRHKRVVLFSASGVLLKSMHPGAFSGVAIHDGTIFAPDYDKAKCVVFK
jgi:DNA-binding beta-propeller fold protein YncE